MITAEELVQATEPEKEQNNFKLGVVAELFDNKTAKVQFDGEDIPSEKQYAYLESYKPTKDDRVLLAQLGGTYIILGKVNYNVSPPEQEVIDRYIFDAKTVSILKGLQVSGALTINNGATIVGNVGVNGNINAVEISASGALKGNSISTTGNLDAGSTTLSSLDVNGATNLKSSVNVSGTLTANGTFQHRGSNLGFFNMSPTYKRTVNLLSGSQTVDSLHTKINSIISALSSYGLINT